MDSGETTTFPHIITLHLSTRLASKWLFVLGLPKVSPETARVGISATLQGYNFMLRPLIGMRSEAKL